jgi:hypothetical protein
VGCQNNGTVSQPRGFPEKRPAPEKSGGGFDARSLTPRVIGNPAGRNVYNVAVNPCLFAKTADKYGISLAFFRRTKAVFNMHAEKPFFVNYRGQGGKKSHRIRAARNSNKKDRICQTQPRLF